MQGQLNVTLLKAILQVHELVALAEGPLSREHTRPRTMNVATAEVKLRKNLNWKQNEVPARIDTFSHSLPFDVHLVFL